MTSPRPLRLGALALVAAALAGCVDPGTVRVALLEESFDFAPDAPAPSDPDDFRFSCIGAYDPEARVVSVHGPEAFRPTFAVVVHRANDSRAPGGGPDPMAGRAMVMHGGSSGDTLFGRVEVWVNDRTSSGSWGLGSLYGGPDVQIRYDGRGPTFDGERVGVGERVERTIAFEGSTPEGTFGVTRTLSFEYLGRLPYRIVDGC